MGVSAGDKLSGQYRVTKLLGRGGMGEVWAAESTEDGRSVAIKVLLDRASRRKDIVRRFQREADVVARIQSPHVCALLDTGTTPEGGLFIVFEYLQGESLADRLRREQFLATDEVGRMTVGVLRGIADAHAAKVLHRDLKPGNIFLEPTPEGGERAVVLDFGVSKLIKPMKVTDEPSLTAFDGTVGSFAYMAPEQVRGAARVDERADVYGSAAVAFRAVVGRLPFEGISARMVASLKMDHPPPSLEDATGFRWPAALEEFFSIALARQPSDRFDSAEEALAALEKALRAIDQARENAFTRG